MQFERLCRSARGTPVATERLSLPSDVWLPIGGIYLSDKDGEIFAVNAGNDSKLLSANPMVERLMAIPALWDCTMYIRAARSLFAI